MYLTEFWASCRRRWWLALLLLCLSTVACVGAARAISPTYEAQASLVLIPPRNAEDPEANRYLDLGSLSDSVDVLARSMSSADTAEELERQVPDTDYAVSHDLTTSAPIVLIATASSDRPAASEMLDLLLARVPRTLDELQADIDVEPRFRITSQVVSQDPEPVANDKSRVRLLGVLAAALLFLSAVAVAVLDGLLIRRARRRQADGPPEQPWTDTWRLADFQEPGAAARDPGPPTGRPRLAEGAEATAPGAVRAEEAGGSRAPVR